MSKWNVGKCSVCGNDLAASVVCVIENSPTESYRHGVLVECPECKTRYKSVLSTASTASIAENIRTLVDRMNAENLAIYETFSKQSTETPEEEPEATTEIHRRTPLAVVYNTMREACPRYGVDFCISMGRKNRQGESMSVMDSLMEKYLKDENIPASDIHHHNNYNGNSRRYKHIIKQPCVILTLPTTTERAKKGVCFGVVYSMTEMNGMSNYTRVRNALGIKDVIVPRYLKESEVRIPTLCKQLIRARESFELKRNLLFRLGLISKDKTDSPANMEMWSNKEFVADLKAALNSNLPGKVERQARELVEKYGLFVTL